MTRRLGDRATFAIEVGETRSPQQRVAVRWAADKWLTTDDNVASLPSFVCCLRSSAARVRRRDVRPCPFPERSPQAIFRLLQEDETEYREQFWFLDWDETLDNVSRYAYLDDELVIIFAFWRATQLPGSHRTNSSPSLRKQPI